MDWNSGDMREFQERLDGIDSLVDEYKTEIAPTDNLDVIGEFAARLEDEYVYFSKTAGYVTDKRGIGKPLKKLEWIIRRLNRKTAPIIYDSEKRLDELQVEISKAPRGLENISFFDDALKRISEEEEIYEALNYREGLERAEALKEKTERIIERLRVPSFSSPRKTSEKESLYSIIKNNPLFKIRRAARNIAILTATGVFSSAILYGAVKGAQGVVSKAKESGWLKELEERKNQVLELKETLNKQRSEFEKRINDAYEKAKDAKPIAIVKPEPKKPEPKPAYVAPVNAPAVVKGFAAQTEHFTHIIYVDKDENTVSLYRKASPLERIKTWSSTDGLMHGPKTRKGDMRTPEGFYLVTYMKSREEGMKYNPLLGDYVIRFNYPNNHEKGRGYTGGGIVFAGTYLEEREAAIRSGLDITNGGIVMLNSDIRELYNLIKPHMEKTVVVIEDSARPLRW